MTSKMWNGYLQFAVVPQVQFYRSFQDNFSLEVMMIDMKTPFDPLKRFLKPTNVRGYKVLWILKDFQEN